MDRISSRPRDLDRKESVSLLPKTPRASISDTPAEEPSIFGNGSFGRNSLAGKELRDLSQRSSVQISPRQLALESAVFGKIAWNTYFGDVGEVDPIPEALIGALEEPCPFTKGKKVKDTHVANWVPEKVNNGSLYFKKLPGLVIAPKKEDYIARYNATCSDAFEYDDKPIKKGFWMLLTKTVIEGSRGSLAEQEKFLKEKPAESYIKALIDRQINLVKSYPGYEVPTLLPTATAILTHFTRTGEYLYNNNPWTFTLLQEKTGDEHLTMGTITPNFAVVNGLRIKKFQQDRPFWTGVGAMWRFESSALKKE